MYSETVPADHCSLSAGVEFRGRVSDDFQVELTGQLLSCLSYLHVDLPAEEVLKVLVDGEREEQQQQERQHAVANAGIVVPLTPTPASLSVGASFSQSSSTSAPVSPCGYVPLPSITSPLVSPATPTPLPPPAASWSPSLSSSLDIALPHSGFAAAAGSGAASSTLNSLRLPCDPVYPTTASACESQYVGAQMRGASSGAAAATSLQVQQRSPGDTAAAPLAASHQLAAAASEAAAPQQARQAENTQPAAVPGETESAVAQAAAAGSAPVHASSMFKLVAELYADHKARIQLHHLVPLSPACPAPIPPSTPLSSPPPAGPSSSCCSPSCTTAPSRLTWPAAAADEAVGRRGPVEEGKLAGVPRASCAVSWLLLKACGTLSSVSSGLPAMSSCSAAAAAPGAAAAHGANHGAKSTSSSSSAAAAAEGSPSSASAATAPASSSTFQPLVDALLAGPSTTLEQLQLVLELLLLTWRDSSKQQDVNGLHGWGWLLLLGGCCSKHQVAFVSS